MAVTSTQVITETAIYVPESNTLTPIEMDSIATEVITLYGDDDSNLGKIKCDFLKRIADINSIKTIIDSAGIKSEKLGDHSVTYDTGSKDDPWTDYKDKVTKTICPIFGVTEGTFTVGVKVNPSPPIDLGLCDSQTSLMKDLI